MTPGHGRCARCQLGLPLSLPRGAASRRVLAGAGWSVADQGPGFHLKQVTGSEQGGHLNGRARRRPGGIDDGVAGSRAAGRSATPIPARFDHERGDLSPALSWDGVPEGTAGLVLLVDDPDAPVQGSFVHWVLYNLDPARQGIAEGEEPAEAAAGANGFGRPGYLGPAAR